MTDTQWGSPLTGEQMKLLRAAGLDGRTLVWYGGYAVFAELLNNNGSRHGGYRLPANHIAYTLLKAGWLDGRNVRLWFGGDKAPDDWDGVTVLHRHGVMCPKPYRWTHEGNGGDIIAYIAKDEDAIMDHLDSLLPETVTIAKMEKAEAYARLQKFHPLGQVAAFEALKELGLIKEPTREERFWALHEPEGTTIPTHIKKWVKDALEFER